MDIGSKSLWPANALSNFTAHAFTIDGVECASMEGFLQSLKFEDSEEQAQVCKLVGFAAKKRGRARTKVWQAAQTLWWRGQPYPRDSDAYQDLLDRAYFNMLVQSKDFRIALESTGEQDLTHTIGRSDPKETVLTEQEFCSRLINLRGFCAVTEAFK